MGMMLGGGVGREVATWVTEGSPSLDMFHNDVARFHPDGIRDKKWIIDRTHESYAKTYSIVFPHDEPLAGRGIRKSALYDALLQQGCIYQARQEFERPGWFEPDLANGAAQVKDYDYYGAYEDTVTGTEIKVPAKHEEHLYNDAIEGELTFGWGKCTALVAEECLAARTGVVLFDQSYFGKFFLEGPDAGKAIDWLSTMDSSKSVGSVSYSTLCNARGGVEMDLTITKLTENKFYFAAGGSTSMHDWRWISNELEKSGFQADLRDASADYCMISVQGPYSKELITSAGLSDLTLDDDSIPFSTCRHAKIAGHELMVLRLTFVGELGYELHVPSSSSLEVYEALMAAGGLLRAKGIRVSNSGYRAIDSMSAEKGFRHWHADLTNADTPMEAGIGFVALAKLKTDKPFLGREALEKQRAEGLPKKLVCLTIDDNSLDQPPLHGRETLYRNGECVGFIKSTAFGFAVGKQIAYGYVNAPDGQPLKPKQFNEWLSAGEWCVGDRGVLRKSSLHLKSPFDPKNARIKGQYTDADLSETWGVLGKQGHVFG